MSESQKCLAGVLKMLSRVVLNFSSFGRFLTQRFTGIDLSHCVTNFKLHFLRKCRIFTLSGLNVCCF